MSVKRESCKVLLVELEEETLQLELPSLYPPSTDSKSRKTLVNPKEVFVDMSKNNVLKTHFPARSEDPAMSSVMLVDDVRIEQKRKLPDCKVVLVRLKV